MPHLTGLTSLTAAEKWELANIYDSALGKETRTFVEYHAAVPKHRFLAFAVHEHRVLLHGSNWEDIEILEPRQANCSSKKFGNLKAVYAVEDPILPIFHAIKDKDRFRGMAQSGWYMEEGDESKRYHFAVTAALLRKQPWSRGVVYVLSRDTFLQGENDDGSLIDEWASEVSIRPLMKLAICPEDFPFLYDIEPL